MKNIFIALLFSPILAFGQSLTVDMYLTSDKPSDNGQKIGQVLIQDSELGGILISPQLTALPPGVHGFHIHVMPSCGANDHDGHMMPAGSAGGHFDPANTNKHLGPYGKGHLGDLPVLIVDGSGAASIPVLAPRLKLSELHGHSLMIHLNGDNYSDSPNPLGGAGARIACGVIK